MPPIDRREYLKTTSAVASLPVLSRVGRADRNDAVDQRQESPPDPPPAPTDLRTEYQAAPENLPPSTDPATADGADPAGSNGDAPDPFVPRFSWRVPAVERGAGQRAYRLLVASSPELLDVDVGDVYDSGRVDSGQSTAVSFDVDETLVPDETYYWKVRVWDVDDEPSPWSEPAQFTMAIPGTQDHWKGTWITSADGTADPKPKQVGPARNERSPLLRKEVSFEKKIETARAHVVTLGYGELYVNGERIGDEQLNPGWTAYRHRVLFSTHDVTGALREGDNAVGLWLGRGWFSKEWGTPPDDYPGSAGTLAGILAGRAVEGGTDTEVAHHLGADLGNNGPPAALVQLNLEFADGTTESVVTDTSWNSRPSPIVENDLWEGETYDALLEQPGWSEPGFDAVGWVPAAEHPLFEGPVTEHAADPEQATTPADPAIRPQRTQPIEITQTLDPVGIHEFEGDYVVDFGQNFAGWVELTIRGATSGDAILLKHAERRYENGDIDRRSTRTAAASDTYVAKGVAEETYEPRFTYHGFRYVKIEGYPGALAEEDVTGKVVHTAFEQTGSFACSNEELNQVQHNTVWSLRTNAHSVITDCPQRDERFAWTECWRGAPSDLFNFDAGRFYEKWLRDHADIQHENGTVWNVVPFPEPTSQSLDPNWEKSRVMTPWTLYRHWGDERVLAEHYEGMKAFVDYWHDRAQEGERDHVVPGRYTLWGDHAAPEGRSADPDPALLATFAHYQTTEAVAETAAVLGRDADAETYRERADAIAVAFNDAFFHPDANTYGNGTQSEVAVALFLGIVPDDREQAVADRLATKIWEEDDGKLQTGSPTTRALLYALVEYGHEELAYHIVSQPEQPGWVYMVRNGATTLWETWNNLERNEGAGVLNSFNHRLWMEVSAWFYRTIAGINVGDPGFEHVEITPRVVDDLEWAEGATDTVRGEVASRWERTDEGLDLEVTIPWNSSATVRVPDLGADEVTLRERDRVVWHDRRGSEGMDQLPGGIEAVSRTAEAAVVEVGSGTYEFALERLTDDGEDDRNDDEGDESDPGQPVPPGDDWTDYTLGSRFTVEDTAAGFVFRAQDAGNCYMWQVLEVASVPDGHAYLLRPHVFENGGGTALGAVPFVRTGEEEWHDIDIELRGSTIETYVDGEHVDTTEDSTFESGTVGFRAHGGIPEEHMLVDAVEVADPAGDVLFATDFSYDAVRHFPGGRIADDALELHRTGVVLREG